MDIRLTLFTSIIAAGFLLLVLILIKRAYLTVRYALIWFTIGAIFVILSIFPKSLNYIAESIGVVTPANALFFLGLIAVLFLLMALTIAISKLSHKNKILSQEMAIRTVYIKELQDKVLTTPDSDTINNSTDSTEKEISVN